jgi:DNA-3-methyladenine glycosylase
MKVLPRSFYARPPIEVARGLLGKVLVHGALSGRIVEVEAYLGEGDLAAHCAAGITNRTRVIFGPPGHAYVYLIYGMYECLNVVCEPDGTPGCVLIRALEPLAPPSPLTTTNGPGKLTRALGITRALNGADFTKGVLRILDDRHPQREIRVTPRIGITKGVDLPLRFLLTPSHTSRK